MDCPLTRDRIRFLEERPYLHLPHELVILYPPKNDTNIFFFFWYVEMMNESTHERVQQLVNRILFLNKYTIPHHF